MTASLQSVKRIVIAVLVLLVSCGYRPQSSTVPGGGSAVHVPTAKNKTSYPDLSGPLTSAVRRRLSRDGLLVVGKGHGAAQLQITILEVRTRPGMLGTEGNRLEGNRLERNRLIPIDTIWRIQTEAELTEPGGAQIASGEQFMVEGRAFSPSGALSEESLGHRRRQALLDDLADAISKRLFLDRDE